jgi:hypothetical protein
MKILVFVLFSLFLFSCVNESKKEKEHSEVNPGKKSKLTARDTLRFEKDSIADNTARFIAGLNQLNSNEFSKSEERVFWKNFKTRTETNWNQVEKSRLVHMRNWQSDFFSTQVGDTLPLFYPFSGPDFVHAFVLYPNAPIYVFCALEPIVELPKIHELSDANQKLFLTNVDNALRDIYQKSYFITNHMSGDLTSSSAMGVIPIFYVFFERTGCELIQSNVIRVDDQGTIFKKSLFKGNESTAVKGMEFIIKKPNDSLYTKVYYFNQDISNKGLKKNPGLIFFLDELGKVNTFVKSASYLMQYSTFSQMRSMVMSMSNSIFQDDTGIPYEFFKNNSEWKVTLFGEYTRPVKDFSDHTIQEDLDSAYQAIGWDNTLKLPFRLGYHWFGDKRQNHQLMVRKSVE